VVVVTDHNVWESAHWHDFLFGANWDIFQPLLYFHPGANVSVQIMPLGVVPVCGQRPNVDWRLSESSSSLGTRQHRIHFFNTTIIRPGDELTMDCGRDSTRYRGLKWKSRDHLEENLSCLSTDLSPSLTLTKGTVLFESPVVAFEQRDMTIPSQSLQDFWQDRSLEVVYRYNASHTKHQLLLNECFGHHDSDILLLPLGYPAQTIRHGSPANVGIRWSNKLTNQSHLAMPPHYVTSKTLLHHQQLGFSYFALRDILPGEELFMDFGEDWSWEKHPSKPSQQHVLQPAVRASVLNENERVIRTIQEQQQNPYPGNVLLTCWYRVDYHNLGEDETHHEVEWNPSIHYACLRPCSIQNRQDDFYTALMHARHLDPYESDCYLEGTHIVSRIPRNSIQFVDLPLAQEGETFRHWKGVSPDFYPPAWLKSNYEAKSVDFVQSRLKPLELTPIVWKESGASVHRNAFQLGLPAQVSHTLLDYCRASGLLDILEHLIVHRNPLTDSRPCKVGHQNWVAKPSMDKTMHWLAPSDLEAHSRMLRILSAAGMDSVLTTIGNQLGFQQLTIHHLTVLGLSRSVVSSATVQSLGLQLSFPLLLGDSSPKLGLQDESNPPRMGRYKYQHDVATLFGDGVIYSAPDLDTQDEMIVFVNIYLVNPDHIHTDKLLETDIYPRHRSDLFQAEHWRIEVSSIQLPKPRPVLDGLDHELTLGEIFPLTWNGGNHAENAYQVGLSHEFLDIFHGRMDRMDLNYLYEELLVQGNSYEAGEDDEISIRGFNWLLYRPSQNDTNEHWVAPRDENAFTNFLSLLSEAGLNAVLKGIGNYFKLGHLAVCQASFFGLSYSFDPMMRNSRISGNHAFEMIIPLILPVAGRSTLEIGDEFVEYVHRSNSAFLIGSGTLYSFGRFDYRQQSESFVGVSLRVAEITEHNIDNVMETLMPGFPQGQRNALMKLAGAHWSTNNPSRRLPSARSGAGDFVTMELEPAQIESIRWIGRNEVVNAYAFQIGLPPELTPSLLKYCEEMGIIESFKTFLLYGEHLQPGKEVGMKLKRFNWYVQRPKSFWQSNMHWISPGDKEAQEDYLKVLSRGGFDKILDAIGRKFNLEGLTAYHITFIGVSHCDQGYVHYDFKDTGGKTFNVIVPLILASDGVPELELSKDGDVLGSYKYQYGVASLVGDECYHATAAVDYRESREIRMAATIYISDIQESNLQNLMADYTQVSCFGRQQLQCCQHRFSQHNVEPHIVCCSEVSTERRLRLSA
jgi:hypothetical protein